jgi:non-ribosomal peptide synthase protein (TIGR01720 family)
MLRARLDRSGDGAVWGLHVRAAGTVRAESCVRRADLSGQTGAGRQPVLAAEFTAARARLAPGQGEMVQIVWFDHGAERPGQLLLVIHHLAIDGVSWRILLPDLRDAWQSAASGRDIALKPAGTSFRRWSEGLLIAAQDPRWASTVTAWTRMLPGPAPRIGRRPRDRDADVAGRTRGITLDLDARVTDALLTQVSAAFAASIRDVLLVGLALAIAEAGGARSVLIDLEGHGREDIVDGADVTPTIGWFTSIFPVRIDLGEAGPGRPPITGEFVVAMVKQVKEQLRNLPAGGAAYGLLRYLNPVTGPVLAALPAPEVCFNYLGRFSVPEDDDAGEPWLPRADTGTLASPSPDLPVAHLLEAVAVTLARPDGARLSISLTWPEEAMDASGVERLGHRWVAILQLLAEHVAATGATGLTPSDLPLLTLSQAEIDEFESMY